MVRFDVEEKGEDTYYLHCFRAGTEIRAFFMVAAANFDIDPTINVYVKDPNGKSLNAFKNKSMGRIQFDTTMVGEYKFVFSNLKSKEEKFVTFSIHNQEEKEQEDYMINKEDGNMEKYGDQEMQRYVSEILRDLNNVTVSS